MGEIPNRIDESEQEKSMFDDINKAMHYNTHPSGVECIDVAMHENFNIGNVLKYIWRRGKKENLLNSHKIKDLEKAKYYLDKEIERLKNECPF